MGKQRRRYEPEFKAEAVRQVRQQGRPVAEVARNLGITSNSLHTWVKELTVDGVAGTRRVHRNAETEQVRRLEKELREAREERDILKKAVAFFAKQRKSGSAS